MDGKLLEGFWKSGAAVFQELAAYSKRDSIPERQGKTPSYSP